MARAEPRQKRAEDLDDDDMDGNEENEDENGHRGAGAGAGAGKASARARARSNARADPGRPQALHEHAAEVRGGQAGRLGGAAGSRLLCGAQRPPTPGGNNFASEF